MKAKLILIVLSIVIILIPGLVMAAATVTRTGNVVEITAIDADWLWSTTFPNDAYIRVSSIEFKGGAANDIMVIKDQTAAGAILFYRKTPDTDYNSIKYFFGARMRPVIDLSDCTLTAGHKVIIVLDPDR